MDAALLTRHDCVDVLYAAGVLVLRLADDDGEILARALIGALASGHVQIFAVGLGHNVEPGDPAALLHLLAIQRVLLHALAEALLPDEPALHLVVLEAAVVAAVRTLAL